MHADKSTEENHSGLLKMDGLNLEIDLQLIALVGEKQGGQMPSRVGTARSLSDSLKQLICARAYSAFPVLPCQSHRGGIPPNIHLCPAWWFAERR